MGSISLDRILLAVMLTCYTATRWEPTIEDKIYHQRELIKKQQEIEYNQRRTQYQEVRNYRG